MALSGLEIYKLLPKTNCKDCGFPTCLAFAMKLASKQADLASCPHVSAEAKEALAAASAPPIRLVTLGAERKLEIGNETVMYRHEKTFFHEPGLALRIDDNDPALEEKVAMVDGYVVERVGIDLTMNAIAIANASGNAGAFADAVKKARSGTQLPFILISDDPAAMGAALAKEGGLKPLVCGATAGNVAEMAAAAKAAGASLVVRADTLEGLAELTEAARAAGVEDLVLDPAARDLGGSLSMMTQIRRLALKKNFRALGYPMIAFPGEGAESAVEETIRAVQCVVKYAGIIVLNTFDEANIYALMTLRQNIYTDPQKPIQVSPGLYELNDPTADAPLMVTTNFSLTYFSVAGEVEGTGKPAWLLITDSEGMSVLTAWAAGKFEAETIAKAVKAFEVEGKIAHRKIVLPGYVATISGDLEEELPGWEILVGPRESVDIPAYLKVWQ
jgi:acetyl-CoA decarbonylase/synthase, CODH/ACS complex subunit gamma